MSLVIRVGPQRAKWWLDTLQELLPDIDCHLWNNPGPADKVQYAVVWDPPTGWLRTFPNLKAIFSVGAGIDHILADKELPAGIPIVRTTGNELRQRVREYAALHVLRFHRKLPEIEVAQKEHKWTQYVEPLAGDIIVGVMGFGNLGKPVAQSLHQLGYSVRVWARSNKSVDFAEVYVGNAQLEQFLKNCNIVVCLLPLTHETVNLLRRDFFDSMPGGSYLIHAGRGQQLIDRDLIDALDSGQLGGATLDVFREEPLPVDHPFWSHPKILITSHTAGFIDPDSGGQIIARNVRAFQAGEDIADAVDLIRGY